MRPKNDYVALAPTHLLNNYNTWLLENAIRSVLFQGETCFPLIKAPPLWHKPPYNKQFNPSPRLTPALAPDYGACFLHNLQAYKGYSPLAHALLSHTVALHFPTTGTTTEPLTAPLSVPQSAKLEGYGVYRLTDKGFYLVQHHVKPLNLLPPSLYKRFLVHNSQQAAKLLYKLSPRKARKSSPALPLDTHNTPIRPFPSLPYQRLKPFRDPTPVGLYYDLTAPLQPLESLNVAPETETPINLIPPPPQPFTMEGYAPNRVI